MTDPTHPVPEPRKPDASASPSEVTGTFADPNVTSDHAPDAASAANDPSSTTGYEPSPGERLPTEELLGGRYVLGAPLGEGGMGSVYRAEQIQPVRREVAVKLIRQGMDFSRVIARFEAERQALALMDHPNIAKVFDAGTTPDGRPYFVMELVRGLPLTSYSDQNRLTISERLELFVQVCHAVQHAHQKGIMHRDLKPSNVLVMEVDGKPVPKVIDFGLAKALQAGSMLPEVSQDRPFGSILGTPLYMAPEQAEPGAVDVDTRADVYALGVILYELLAGSTPLTRETLQKAALGEMLRLVREEEPPTLISRLRSSPDLPSIAAVRKTEPAWLTKLLRGDLEWIARKCLEKERSHRYETANGLAADVQRYLRDEPISAGPPSSWYRFRKFVRRNRTQVFTAGFVLLALIVGTIGTSIGLVRAENARQAEAEQRTKAERAQENEAKERLNAEAKERETASMMQFVEDRIFAAGRPVGQQGGLGRDVTLRRAVEASLANLETDFAEQPIIQGRMRVTLGMTLYYLGDLQQAEQQIRRGRELLLQYRGEDHQDSLTSLNNLATVLYAQGSRKEALALHQDCLRRREKLLGPDHVDTLRSMNGVAITTYYLGQRQQGMEILEELRLRLLAKLGPDHPETLTVTSNLAAAYSEFARYQEAFELRKEVLDRFRVRSGPEHPDTLRAMMLLGNSYTELGRGEEAIAMHQKALVLRQKVLGEDHVDTLRSQTQLAIAHYSLGRYDDARKEFEGILAVQTKKYGKDFVENLGLMNNVASCYFSMNKYEEALKQFIETYRLRQKKIGKDHPDTLWNVLNVATTFDRLKREKEALPFIEEALRDSKGKENDPGRAVQILTLQTRAARLRGDAEALRDAVAKLEKLNRNDLHALYSLAADTARLAELVRKSDPTPAGARQADADAKHAVELLKRARASGGLKVANLETDESFASLRNREDFQALLKSMLAEQASKKQR